MFLHIKSYTGLRCLKLSIINGEYERFFTTKNKLLVIQNADVCKKKVTSDYRLGTDRTKRRIFISET